MVGGGRGAVRPVARLSGSFVLVVRRKRNKNKSNQDRSWGLGELGGNAAFVVKQKRYPTTNQGIWKLIDPL